MRLKCRFTVEAGTTSDRLDKYKYKVAEAFVSDLEKQGWKYEPNRLPASERGFKLTGPFPATPVKGLPSRAEQFRFNAQRDMARVLAGDKLRATDLSYVSNVPLLGETDKWEYELSAVFIHEEILVETQRPIGEL